ncbi:MAG TPA: prepilin-type N-terminal cleavage/methylation domain-containing protein [Acidimicrobiales bacterium]|nr:prepilin-type N-terminal cleavage/methylation domain-containing protein [Acidimicrobiales bacterium]
MVRGVRRLRGADAGFTVVELLVVLMVMAILLAIAVPLFLGQRSSSGDVSAQQLLKGALLAANDVYNDTQDYTQVTAAALAANDREASFVSGQLTAYAPSTVGFATGALGNGDAGGYIGLAAYSRSGTCWLLYKPADAAAVTGSSSGLPCSPPTAPPSGRSW